MVTAEDIGRRVADGAGRVGILRDVVPDYEDPADPPTRRPADPPGDRRKRPTAFPWPAWDGREWLVPPDHVARA
ncbi:hypothetical protein SSP531S_47330 [Streptomyces spongiicola]|uniref:Uncharacterized protein n=1 Tax=Streptomyces spongiicola TaxID=1690221 RepID=A0A388T2V9_9ACTN|nr:hypothetical protein [Streptomyces spongiicola]GBQ03263.1 hypothetical protein SSP531S_47330 [Streptomyces spongiicola]